MARKNYNTMSMVQLVKEAITHNGAEDVITSEFIRRNVTGATYTTWLQEHVRDIYLTASNKDRLSKGYQAWNKDKSNTDRVKGGVTAPTYKALYQFVNRWQRRCRYADERMSKAEQIIKAGKKTTTAPTATAPTEQEKTLQSKLDRERKAHRERGLELKQLKTELAQLKIENKNFKAVAERATKDKAMEIKKSGKISEMLTNYCNAVRDSKTLDQAKEAVV